MTTRYVLRLVCPACGRCSYAAVSVLLAPWAACAGGRLQPGAVWDLAREAWPAWRVMSNAAVQP